MDQNLSDQDLDELHGFLLRNGADPYEAADQMQAIRSKYGPGQGRTAQDPAEASLFSDTDRVKAGFGNPQGVAPQLAQKGYKNPQYLNGELEAQGPDGKWVRDQTNFFRRGPSYKPSSWLPEHPLNWAEANLGSALPLAGKTAGQMGGRVVGALGGPAAPVTIPAAAAAGGAAGGVIGEGLRQDVGDYLGTYRGDGSADAADQAKEGAIGGLFPEIPVPYAKKLIGKEGTATVGNLMDAGVNKSLDLGRTALAQGAGFLSRIHPENIETLIKAPFKVWGMGHEGADVELAKQGQAEVTGKIRELGEDVGYANRGLNASQGQANIHPKSAGILARQVEDVLRPYRPGNAFAGKMEPHELKELDDLVEQHFYRPLTPGRPAPSTIPQELIKTKEVGADPIASHLGNYFQTSEPVIQHSIPSATVEGLQEAANKLGSDVGSAWDRNPIGPSRSDAATQVRQKLYGMTKAILHEIDNGPGGLAEADSAFHAARNAGKLLAPLNNPAQQQGFVHQLANSPIKDAARTAAAGSAEEGIPAMAPQLAEQLPYLRAALDMAKKSTERNVFLTGAGGATALGEHLQNPAIKIPAMIGLGLGLAGHPLVVKYGIGGASAATAPIWSLLRSRAGAQGLMNMGVPHALDSLSETLKNQK